MMDSIIVHRGPLAEMFSVAIAQAIGSETDGMNQNTQMAGAITSDKILLAQALSEGGAFSVPTETLEDLVNKVFGLSINVVFNMNDRILSENHFVLSGSVLDTLKGDSTDSNLSDIFGNQNSFSVTCSGGVWLHAKWNQLMTSNTTPSGYSITPSTESVGYEAWKCMNGTNSSDSDCWLTSTGIVDGDLVYRDDSGGVVVSYYITSRNSVTAGAEGPKDWALSGSNDGIAWTEIDSRAGITWVQNEKKTFDVSSNSTSYSYYKLSVTENNGSENFLSIGEFELRSAPYGVVTF